MPCLDYNRWEGSPAGIALSISRVLTADPELRAIVRCYNRAEAEDVRHRIPENLWPRAHLTWLEWKQHQESLGPATIISSLTDPPTDA